MSEEIGISEVADMDRKERFEFVVVFLTADGEE